jgi:hypothetical protein
MGRLTEDMTRLCGEIVALRRGRKDFVKDLTHSVTAMKSNLRRARHEMARKTKAERRGAVSHLKKMVGAMRHAFAADLDGARRAWAGK